MVDKTYRILVWGPGGLGLASIYEILRNPRFELVGVRAFNPAKAGLDAGELVAEAPLNVLVTCDPAQAMAIDCDCVIYTARDHGDYHNHAEIVEILRAGKNVVTALPYQHVRLVRDPRFAAKLERACREGNSTFHATGVDPDVISDRVLLALTGFCNDIRYVILQENWDFFYTPADTLALCGFGRTPEEAQQMPVAGIMADNFLKQVCLSMAEGLGVKYTRVHNEHEYIPALEDIRTDTALIKAGTVGRVTHRWSGYTAESDEKAFFTIEVNWHMGESMLPAGVAPNQYWVATIEGRPSVKMSVDLKASMETKERFLKVGTMNSEPGYHAVVATFLQTIPLICAAPPGIMPIALPPVRWQHPSSL